MNKTLIFAKHEPSITIRYVELAHNVECHFVGTVCRAAELMETPTAMEPVMQDRRHEPRFPLPGRFRSIAPAGLCGRVLDLSLNGALLECDDKPQCAMGEHVEMLLELDDSQPFAAKARVAHVEGQRLGIEFHEIEPPAFEQLSDLVLTLKRAPVLAKLSQGSD